MTEWKDCKGKKLEVGDMIKYRSIYSKISSRTRKEFLARIIRFSYEMDIHILSGPRGYRDIGIGSLNRSNAKHAAIEKLPDAKAMLWKLEE